MDLFIAHALAESSGEITKVESKELIAKLQKVMGEFRHGWAILARNEKKWHIATNTMDEYKPGRIRPYFVVFNDGNDISFEQTICVEGDLKSYSLFECNWGKERYYVATDLNAGSADKGVSYYSTGDGVWFRRAANSSWVGMKNKISDRLFELLTSTAHHESRKFLSEQVCELTREKKDIELVAATIAGRMPDFEKKYLEAKKRLIDRLQKL